MRSRREWRAAKSAFAGYAAWSATLVSGVAGALGYRGSLQVVNRIAPSEQRAELVSSYYVVTFLGNSLPVIGVGVVTTLAGALAASIGFAATIGALQRS
jgi:hypothetical protein